MAKQLSFIKLKGNVGGLNFFKNKDGYSVRQKGGAVKSRILKEDEYARTRENMAEFTNIKRSVKTLRIALNKLIEGMPDGNAANRLSTVFTKIKNLDTTGKRGERTVKAGILTERGIKQLKGFNFTDKGLMSKVVNHPYIINVAERTLKFLGLQALSEIYNPFGAHVAGFILFNSKVDFSVNSSSTSYTEEFLINLDNDNPQDVELVIPAAPLGDGVNVYAIRIVFYKTEAGINTLIDRRDYFVGQILSVN